MNESGWTLAWSEPARLAFAIDHSSPTAVTFRTGETGVVQFDLGQDARLTLETASGLREVVASDLPAGIVPGVVAVHWGVVAPARTGEREDSATPVADLDATILTARVAPVSQLDFDATILTPAPAMSAPGADFDATILTPAPAHPAAQATPANAVQITDATGARVVRLDRALYVGRAPRVPNERGSANGSLAFVQSATDHVSTTHLQLRDDDGTVLARDLRSTNGTTVAPPVGPPFRLSPGEAVPVAAGTRIRLSDDVVIEVLPAEALGGQRAD